MNRYYIAGVGGNGEDMWVSEPYFSKSNAKRAAFRSTADTGIKVYDCTKLGRRVQL